MAGVLDEDRGFVFIHVPKCAGRSITEILLHSAPPAPFGGGRTGRLVAALRRSKPARSFRDLDGLREVVDRENMTSGEVVRDIGHARARDIRALIGTDTYERLLSFSVVRNPWDRLSSRYHFFQGRPRAEDHEVALGSLDDFIRWSCEQRPATMSERLTDRSGKLIVDRILRFESLHDDFAALSGELGLGGDPLPYFNVSPNSQQHTPTSDAVIELVQDTYRDDFGLFGYSPDPNERTAIGTN